MGEKVFIDFNLTISPHVQKSQTEFMNKTKDPTTPSSSPKVGDILKKEFDLTLGENTD